MKPHIDATEFGSITVEGKKIYDDILIRLDGDIKKRKKKLSKEKYGTSHIVSLEEAKHIYDDGADRLIIGNGQNGVLELSGEAKEYFKEKDCDVALQKTPKAVKSWNAAKGKVIAVFHLTC